MNADTHAPIAPGRRVLVVGLGATGLSTARFLHRRGIPFSVVDDREHPPGYDDFITLGLPGGVYLGACGEACFSEADDIILSPGVPLKTPAVQRAQEHGAAVIGDVELFARSVGGRCIAAVTGSNGKSTVATLLAQMVQRAGRNVAVGGNLGPPALDLLDEQDDAEVYVLELSSFQLETTHTLKPRVSVILNVSEDHLDRYDSFHDYLHAKLRIHHRSEVIVVNRGEGFAADLPAAAETIRFGLDAGGPGDFGIVGHGARSIARGGEAWIACDEVPLPGDSSLLNVQAAFAMGCAIGLPHAAMTDAVRTFKGLPHRLQHIGSLDGVDWYDDSKATNVAAAVSALRSVGRCAVLICGGDGKGAGFGALADAIRRHARAAILIGRDARCIADAVAGAGPEEGGVSVGFATDMRDAVHRARDLAQPGDCVLLSPACASLDMFRDYRERAAVFIRSFQELR